MDNPPAFPRSAEAGKLAGGYEGMTLRDWFAGQALPTCMSATFPEWQLKAWFGHRTGLKREEVSARAAYAFADAMLAARAKGPSND